MRLLSVVGTRPQLIKAAALQPVLRRLHEEVFVDTGQHYDPAMAGDFFEELDLAAPDHSLGVRGGRHGDQTGRMLIALEPLLRREAPDAVLVYGDTNSTLAGALAAAKLGIPVAHIEAGLRSFDRRMPEELNRIAVDHLSTWLFATGPSAVAHLAAEGLTQGVFETGDLMQDLAARVSRDVRDPAVLGPIGERLGFRDRDGRGLAPGGYLFATVHRAENREPPAVAHWAALLDEAADEDRPVILALHPGTRDAMQRAGVAPGRDVRVVDPLGYRSALALQLHAAAVLTDSGGVQRECAWFGTPCLLLRRSTEWPELVSGSGGRVVLVGLERDLAIRELARLAPPDAAPRLATERAASLDIVPTGSAEAIARALAVAR